MKKYRLYIDCLADHYIGSGHYGKWIIYEQQPDGYWRVILHSHNNHNIDKEPRSTGVLIEPTEYGEFDQGRFCRAIEFKENPEFLKQITPTTTYLDLQRIFFVELAL